MNWLRGALLTVPAIFIGVATAWLMDELLGTEDSPSREGDVADHMPAVQPTAPQMEEATKHWEEATAQLAKAPIAKPRIAKASEERDRKIKKMLEAQNALEVKIAALEIAEADRLAPISDDAPVSTVTPAQIKRAIEASSELQKKATAESFEGIAVQWDLVFRTGFIQGIEAHMVHVVFNNNFEDQGTRNGATLIRMLHQPQEPALPVQDPLPLPDS